MSSMSGEKLNIYIGEGKLLQVYFGKQDAGTVASLRLISSRPPKHSMSYEVCRILQQAFGVTTREAMFERLCAKAKSVGLDESAMARDLLVEYCMKNGGSQ